MPVISSSSSLSPTFSNTTLSSSRSSLAYLTPSSSTVSDQSSSLPSTSSFYSPSSSAHATTTSNVAVLGGATGASSSSPSSTTTASGNSTVSNNSSVAPTPVIVGGVVGGIAGAAIVIFVLMFLIRWKRRNSTMLSLGSGEAGPGAATTRDAPPSQPSAGMAERHSLAFAVPAALAALTGYKRSSQKTETDRTISSTAGSERGFYRVSGRKLPSVLQSGGDGYGGGVHENTMSMSGSSFYRDSQGLYGGTGSPTQTPAGISIQRDSGIPVMRPSPARTPVTEHGPFSAVPVPLNPPPRRPDALGRSRSSQDGSHASRFTEEV